MQTEWYNSFLGGGQGLVTEIISYIPRVLASVLILIVGGMIARFLKSMIVRLIDTLSVSKAIRNTPIEHFFKEGSVTTRVEEVLGNIFYWIVMLIVLYTAVSVLGLYSLSLLFERILAYLPHILSAVLVLFFGLLLAGFVESMVKGSIRSIDGKSGRLFGRISSYLVMTITVLVAISELGIARDFILVLFIGFITTISLGTGLALGLGGKDLVKKLLQEWYDKIKSDLKE
jgi:hypothetical protein